MYYAAISFKTLLTDSLDFVYLCFSKLYGDQARFFEAEKVPRIKHKKKGTVSMVNNGSGQHGSQVSSVLSGFATILG